MLFTDRPQKK